MSDSLEGKKKLYLYDFLEASNLLEYYRWRLTEAEMRPGSFICHKANDDIIMYIGAVQCSKNQIMEKPQGLQ